MPSLWMASPIQLLLMTAMMMPTMKLVFYTQHSIRGSTLQFCYLQGIPKFAADFCIWDLCKPAIAWHRANPETAQGREAEHIQFLTIASRYNRGSGLQE